MDLLKQKIAPIGPKGPNKGFWVHLGHILGPGGLQNCAKLQLDSFGPSFGPNRPFQVQFGPIFLFIYFLDPHGQDLGPGYEAVLGTRV